MLRARTPKIALSNLFLQIVGNISRRLEEKNIPHCLSENEIRARISPYKESKEENSVIRQFNLEGEFNINPKKITIHLSSLEERKDFYFSGNEGKEQENALVTKKVVRFIENRL